MSGKQPTWFISLGAAASNKERVAVIKKDTFHGAHSASMFLKNNTTQFFAQPVADYSARGDLSHRSFFIYHGSAPVAEVSLTLQPIPGKCAAMLLNCTALLTWYLKRKHVNQCF